MKRFILVGKSARIAISMLQAIRSFSDADCVVIGDADTTRLRWSGLCKRHYLVDFAAGNAGAFAQLVNAIAEDSPQTTLLPFDCDGIKIVNLVRARLQVQIAPIPDLATLEMFDNKWSFYEFCVKNSLNVPTTRYVGSKFSLDFDAIVAELGLPFVLKPTDCSGSEGVRFVESRAYFEQEILDDAAYKFKRLIAQRFVEGTDVDLSLLSVRGELSSFAIQQLQGSHINFLPNAYLEGLAATICRYSAYHGVMHIDARVEKSTGQVFLIECNPRFWASLTAASWCGLNFVGQSVDPRLREAGPVALLSGSAPRRHPLWQPSLWGRLLFDRGLSGRLLRAQFDLYALGQLFGELPVIAFEAAVRRIRVFRRRRQGQLAAPDPKAFADSVLAAPQSPGPTG
jgi:ATP-grasp domain